MGTKMMCSGWMSSVANNVPGSVVLKVIGKRADNTEKEIYAFCPGQIGKSYRRAGAAGITTPSGDMVWQQFYFEFFLNEPCVSYELKVENNCVSTSGGDYFLDDIWVFAQLPKVGPEMTTPLSGGYWSLRSYQHCPYSRKTVSLVHLSGLGQFPAEIPAATCF